MTEIPTAEEFIKSSELVVKFDNTSGCILEEELPHLLVQFAKLHVEAALKNAYDCGTFKGWTNSSDENDHKELFVKNIMSRQSI